MGWDVYGTSSSGFVRLSRAFRRWSFVVDPPEVRFGDMTVLRYSVQVGSESPQVSETKPLLIRKCQLPLIHPLACSEL
jgi:hypothetical protein